jgi:hypothetical protein
MQLDDDTFMLIAAKHYDFNKSLSVEEFHNDIHRFKYVGRLMRRYKKKNELKTRLILNHLIILYNCLGPTATHMLFMKLEEYHDILKPFVLFLNFLPDTICYNGNTIRSVDISMDANVVNELRKI